MPARPLPRGAEVDAAGHARIARAVRQARVAAGWSQRELAARCGVTQKLVVGLESGRDVALSLLRSVLATLPGLDAHDLVLRPSPHPRAMSASAWEASVRLHGCRATLLHRRWVGEPSGSGISTLRLSGLRPEPACADSATVRRLLRCAFLGSAAALARVADPDEATAGVPQVVEEPGVRHALTWRRIEGGWQLDYDWTEIRTAASRGPDARVLGPAARISVPVEELILEQEPVGDPTTEPMRLVASLRSAGSTGPDADLSGYLHPDGVAARWSPATGRAAVVVKRPATGLTYGLAVGEAAAQFGRAAGARLLFDGAAPPAFSEAVRSERLQRGWRTRDLASAAGVSTSTVTLLESGRELRVGAASRVLDALPALAPQHLHRVAPAPREWDDRDLWDWCRAACGLEAERVVKVVQLSDDGLGATRTFLRLRVERPTDAELEIVLGPHVAEGLRSHGRFAAMRVSEPGARTRVRRRETGGADHALVLRPESPQGSRIDVMRRFERTRQFILTAAEARTRGGAEPPFYAGMSYVAHVPVRKLRLEVRFPSGYWPLDVAAHRWPHGEIPDPAELADRRRHLALGLRLLRHRQDCRAAVEVSHAQPGFVYGLSWTLP